MTVISLADAAAANPSLAGGKASRLASLMARGFDVPDGVVITATALAPVIQQLAACRSDERPTVSLPKPVETALRAALAEGVLAGAHVAVRSSAVAEDTNDASFAGMYETYLDLTHPDEIVQAVKRCVESALAPRVAAYRHDRSPLIAVLVQRMVPADCAGVAFSAHPVTGARDVVTISAVRGLGEGLVSGRADAEEWECVGDAVLRRRSPQPVLDDGMAAAVADLTRRVERAEGRPQDVEWATSGGRLFLLQSRPMTVVPEPVRWASPYAGAWVRNFRLGEWIGDPVTPLFESWLLTGIEQHFAAEVERLCGYQLDGPAHIVVNGWYFYNLPVPDHRQLLRKLPRVVWRICRNFRRVAAITPPIAHLGFEHEYRRWREELMPQYRAAVASADRELHTADAPRLLALIETLIARIGDQFVSIVGVAGFAAKAEGPLFAFWKEHLTGVQGSCLNLVRGVETLAVDGHAVQGLDWFLPTLGETGLATSAPYSSVTSRLAREQADLEARVRAALAHSPALGKKFDVLLATARRAHAVRQEQTGAFTLAWPVLRRAIKRLGELMIDQGAVGREADIFFLTRTELKSWSSGSREGLPAGSELAHRHTTWDRQRLLTPPLILGELTGVWKQTFDMIDGLLERTGDTPEGELRGYPGSPGCVTGPARVLRSIGELERLQPGEVLVAPVTTPGWTPAFHRALAVVTDTGSIASHASVVAREFGIPAVVATGDATARLHDGQLVTVDGSRGCVILGAPAAAARLTETSSRHAQPRP